MISIGFIYIFFELDEVVNIIIGIFLMKNLFLFLQNFMPIKMGKFLYLINNIGLFLLLHIFLF